MSQQESAGFSCNFYFCWSNSPFSLLQGCGETGDDCLSPDMIPAQTLLICPKVQWQQLVLVKLLLQITPISKSSAAVAKIPLLFHFTWRDLCVAFLQALIACLNESISLPVLPCSSWILLVPCTGCQTCWGLECWCARMQCISASSPQGKPLVQPCIPISDCKGTLWTCSPSTRNLSAVQKLSYYSPAWERH